MIQHELKLNLGCGMDKRPGYVNIDAHPGCNPDLVLDLGSPNALTLAFEPNSVTQVLARNVLEHFFRFDCVDLLKDIFAILKPGGSLHAQLPDISYLLSTTRMSFSQRLAYIYGGQDLALPTDDEAKRQRRREHPEWFTHRYGWSPLTFTEALTKIGFRPVTTGLASPDFTATAKKP